MARCISVKYVRHPFARKAVDYIKAVTPTIISAPDVCDVSLPQLVGCFGLEEFAFRTNNVCFRILWLNIANFTEYALHLLSVCCDFQIPCYLGSHAPRTICGSLFAYLAHCIHHVWIQSDLAGFGIVVTLAP